MFKRLTKARRHSADEAGSGGVCSTPSYQSKQSSQDDPNRLKNSDALAAGLQPSSFVFSPMTKFSPRRSCGDAYALLADDDTTDQPNSIPLQPVQQQKQQEADYRLVTAVPAFIVEHHEPEKQRGIGVWGLRRMSKKLDSFRRSGSRDSICSTIHERADSNGNSLDSCNVNNCNANNLDSTTNNKNNNNNNNKSSSDNRLSLMNGNGGNDKKTERRFLPNSHRSPSPFKSFFIRMGSTGMLNSSAKNRRSSQNLDDKLERTPEKESLFRSCSTSQLNTSPTYVKGDDPSEGIDLRINTKNEHGKTVSCDNLSNNRHKSEDAFDETLTSATTPSGTFTSCDFTDPANRGGDFMRKSSSCDFKEAKKTNFPYAFLRSKLSVLPEEKNYGNSGASGAFNSPTVGKEERLFKTASEEHFPALKIEDSFTGTTTLGRRRSKNGSYLSRDSVRYRLQDPTSRSARNSYSEYKESYDQRDSGSRYFGPMSLSLMHSGFDENHRNSISLPYQASDILDYRPPPIENAAPLNLDLSYESSSTCSTGNGPATTLPMTSAQLRQQRRNSAPSGEQRLSSHYVSSNESGYDSDGPRGESAASETEALSLKCTDSSDTSSVVDSELEKPMRSSTPSECQHEIDTLLKDKSNLYQDERLLGDGIDAGLRWHQQSGSGRVLPSIHQTSSDSPSSSCSPASSASSSSNSIALSKGMEQALGIQSAAHRVRLQQDKTRFLSDIIQPPKRTRRCRLVQLSKASAKESLGIRLAQQRVGEMRYVIVQLESDGIAQRDGRLRLGDEVVEVEGKDLRNFNSLEEVQDFLRSCEGHSVLLKTAYEETMPQLYSVETPDCDYVDSASLADCSSLTICSSTLPYNLDDKSQKRPDFLPLDSTNNVEGVSSISSSTPMTTSTGTNTLPSQQQYTARKHVARFEKGNGKPSLGFSVVGGVDSPRGEMGIFVRRVFPGGQADVSKSLFQGDEILSLNGKVLRGCTHQEVIELFKGVREGPVELELVRRHRYQKAPLKAALY